MEQEKTSKILIILIIILLVIALAFGGFILIKNKDNQDDYDKTVYEELIKIDASLATQPLADAYVEGLDNFNIEANYSNTDPAYTKLINGEVDMIIVTAPSEGQAKRVKDAGVELELTKVVNEGFVFYTNVNNSVSNLTIPQIQKIYTGEYTNWNQVGGPDASIIAYQRPANSGSQAGIVSLVMNGLKMKEPTKTEYVETMAGIIDVVSNYENGKDAIGYSYYYYATAMYGNDKMKFFSINGVEPTHENIKNGTYPLITSYYVVTLKNNNKPEVEALKKALLSKKGQNIAKTAGYVELGNN